MLLVLPVATHEIALAEKLTDFIVLQGGVKDHPVLLVGALGTAGLLEKIVSNLKKAFNSVDTWIMPTELETGWPASSNFTFQNVVKYLDAKKNKSPWYYFEVDNTPIRSIWLDKLTSEYINANKPFMGVSHPAYLRDPSTKEIKGTDGEFVVGSMIYPFDLSKRSIILRYLTSRIPWDVYMRNEIRPNAHITPLIQFCRQTYCYEKLADKRVLGITLPDREPAEPLSKKAVVLHGCKDGSLIDVLTVELTTK